VSGRPDESDIHVINRNGRRRRNLTRATHTGDYVPAWSSDGQRIAFVRINRNGRTDIVVMTANGKDQLNLTGTQKGTRNWNPAWSPDN
jgi:Tol biopolymer transport system component